MKKLCLILSMVLALAAFTGLAEGEHTAAAWGIHPACASCGGELTAWGQCTKCFAWCVCWDGYCAVSMSLPEDCPIHGGNCMLISSAVPGGDTYRQPDNTSKVYASRQDIWNDIGVFMIDDLSHLSRCEAGEEDGLKVYGTYYPDEIVCHGTSGDMGEWLTADGLMSDVDVDIDGDGINEYLVIRWVDVGDDYLAPNAYACIYESADGGYALAAELPLPGNYYTETEVWLASNADKWYIAGDAIERGDGGWCYSNLIIYEYDGQNARIAMGAGTDNYDAGAIVESNADFMGTYRYIRSNYRDAWDSESFVVHNYTYNSDHPVSDGFAALAGELGRYGMGLSVSDDSMDVEYSASRRIMHICGRHDGKAGDADIRFEFLTSQEHYNGSTDASALGSLDFFGTGTVLPAEPDNFEPVDDTDSEYYIADSNTRLLTREELSVYTKEELGFIRNEILARYGYPFQKEKYREYFGSKSWYVRNEGFVYSMLNEIEMKNVELIKSME